MVSAVSEFNERFQKMFKPSHPSEQTNKKFVLQTLQKFGIPLTPQGFVGGQKAERERYLRESGAVILQDKGFEQNVLDLAAEAPSGKRTSPSCCCRRGFYCCRCHLRSLCAHPN